VIWPTSRAHDRLQDLRRIETDDTENDDRRFSWYVLWDGTAVMVPSDSDLVE
jgi:hypothetical protein